MQGGLMRDVYARLRVSILRLFFSSSLSLCWILSLVGWLAGWLAGWLVDVGIVDVT